MTKTSFRLRTIAMAAAAMAVTAGALAGPALAADWDHRGPAPREMHERHWRVEPHRVIYRPAPAYGYGYVAPAPVYVPAPQPGAPPVSFNLVLPLRIN